MDTDSLLKKLFKSFEAYYTIRTENVTEPFNAEADFICHGEQYILLKIAKVADIDSNDYAYFKIDENLSASQLSEYAKKAWETGLAKVVPYNGHRNSDITLIILADSIDDDAKKLIKKTKFYKSYKFSLWGWSNFRLVAKELSSGKIFYNRFGESLKKVLINI